MSRFLFATWNLPMPSSFGRIVCCFFLLAATDSTIDATHADEKSYETQTGILYRTGIENDDYARNQCRLDLYYPKSATDFSTVVWFHGGGLTKGERAIPDRLKNQGFAVVGAGYRLHPQVTAPVYIEDAAAAVAWTFKNIERHGGSPRKIFVAGHSAGAYLAMMIGFDKQWLLKHDIHADDLARACIAALWRGAPQRIYLRDYVGRSGSIFFVSPMTPHQPRFGPDDVCYVLYFDLAFLHLELAGLKDSAPKTLARLHEIGLSVAYAGYHKHSAYLVTHADMPGFSRDDQQELAAIILGHRRRLPTAAFDELPSERKDRALRLCLALRLAVCLNRSRSQARAPVPRLEVHGRRWELGFDRRWLDQHPLTKADLRDEAGRFEDAGLELRAH